MQITYPDYESKDSTLSIETDLISASDRRTWPTKSTASGKPSKRSEFSAKPMNWSSSKKPLKSNHKWHSNTWRNHPCRQSYPNPIWQPWSDIWIRILCTKWVFLIPKTSFPIVTRTKSVCSALMMILDEALAMRIQGNRDGWIIRIQSRIWHWRGFLGIANGFHWHLDPRKYI